MTLKFGTENTDFTEIHGFKIKKETVSILIIRGIRAELDPPRLTARDQRDLWV